MYRLFTLEEEMGRYYRYSRRKLQGAPAPGCMYAAELNKEWLCVMVDTVEGEHVRCYTRSYSYGRKRHALIQISIII